MRAGIWPRRVARQYGLTLTRQLADADNRCRLLRHVVPDGRSTSAAAEQVSHDPDVAWAQPIGTVRRAGLGRSPNDPLFAAEPAAAQWHLADLHRIATGRGVQGRRRRQRHRSMPSGPRRPDDVNRNFVSGQPLRSNSTAPESRESSPPKADNGVGIAGVAPGARLLGLRACWQIKSSATAATVCDTLSLAKAIYFAVENHADVINLSLSGPDDRLLRELLKLALGKGSTVVTAFDGKLAGGGFPASMAGVIAVSGRQLGTVAFARLHCAWTRCPDHGAGRTMVSRQWQFLCRCSCQRPGRADARAAPLGVAGAGLRPQRRRNH